VAAAVAGVLLASCSGSSKRVSSGTTTSTEASPTTTALGSTTTASTIGATGVSIDVAANAQFANGRQPGYMHSANVPNRTLTIDIIQFFVGDAANKAAKEDRQETPVPNDYYIRNVNPKLYTFPVSASVAISVLASEPDTGGDTNMKSVDFATFASIVNGHASKNETTFNPWWITTSNGTVVKIEEQFVP
jgi:hypothetical protein